jgi:glycine C-acetyltransferase
MRSQIFAKAMPAALVLGLLKRLDLMRKHPELKDKLWENTNALQNGLKAAGFEIGPTDSCVTPVYLSGSIPEATNLIFDLRENYNVFCSKRHDHLAPHSNSGSYLRRCQLYHRMLL